MSRSRAFTVPELLAVVAVIAIIMAVLLPSLSRGREMARRAVCSSNLHQLNIAARNYRADRADWPQQWTTVNHAFYPSIFADNIWLQYLAGREVYGCPSGRKVSHNLPNWDGNWPGPYSIGGFFYVGNLPEQNLSGWNKWGLNEPVNAAQVCRKRDGSADKLLVTEGVQGWGSDTGITGVYFSHGKDVASYSPVDPVYDGIHVMTDPARLATIGGFNRGFGDGHVEWKQPQSEFTNANTMWGVSFKYTHWVWAKWYW